MWQRSDMRAGSEETTKCPSPRSTRSCQAGKVSAHREGSHHPARLPSYNLPAAAAAAVSRTYRSSGWEADELRLFISSSFAVFFPLQALKPHWLDLPAGWVALLPSTQANVFICSTGFGLIVVKTVVVFFLFSFFHKWFNQSRNCQRRF